MEHGSTPAAGEITTLLHRIAAGDGTADGELVERVYAELRRIASNALRKERAGHTLQPTALVHEAYVKLLQADKMLFQNRVHFFALAARVMRRILVDHGRARMSAKRGAGQHVPLTFAEGVSVYPEEFFPPLDDALRRLAMVSPRQAQIVELRFFGGLTEEEIAGHLDLSSRTVKREWSVARAFLHGALSE